jgi:4-amino-4-deoxy-L-arabinose transferase-like glycosyltransferase
MALNIAILACAAFLFAYAVRELAPGYWARASGAMRRVAVDRTPSGSALPVPAMSGTDRTVGSTPALPLPRTAEDRKVGALAWLRDHLLTVVAPASIVALALVLRIVDLTGVPPGFFADEASNALDAYGIAHSLRDQHGVLLPAYFQALGDWRGGFQIYWDVPFVGILGLTEIAVRLGSAVAGAVTVGLTYVFVRKAINLPVGLISAFLLATSQWHLIWSRTGFEMVSVPLVTALFLTFAFIGLERPRWLPLAFVSAALGMYTYQPGRIFFPLLTLAWVLIYWRDLWKWREYTSTGIILGAAVLVPVFRSIEEGTFFARLNQLNGPVQSFSARVSSFLTSYHQHFEPGFLFYTSTDWITRHYVRGFGMLYGIEAPILILGIATMLVRRKRADVLFLCWFLIYPVAAALVGPPVSSRSITGVIVFQIAVAQGVYVAVKGVGIGFGKFAATRPYRRLATIVASIALAIAGLATAAGFMNAYLVAYPRYSADWGGWQQGSQQIVAYFKAHQGRYDRMFMSADFNAPDELLLFLTATNPSACTNCAIANMEDNLQTQANYQSSERELWAVPPAVFEASALANVPYRVVHRITYPDGRVSFVFVATGPGVRGTSG